VPHLAAFCLYGAGVFFMTINIRAELDEEEEGGATPEMGACHFSRDHSAAFAISFAFTRIVLVIMYILYFYFFHESNEHGHAPDLGRNLDAADLEAAALEMTRQMSANSDPSFSSPHSANVHNPISFRSMQQAEDLIRDLHMQNRESVVKRHFTRICLLKIAPAVISSLIILAMVAGVSPMVVLPVVAAVELSGDFITAYFVSGAADWKELTVRREFAMERLGLFFMLVLGEAVLGLAVQHLTSAEQYGTTYPVLV
jgi:low temperature requirement protein LtrA